MKLSHRSPRNLPELDSFQPTLLVPWNCPSGTTELQLGNFPKSFGAGECILEQNPKRHLPCTATWPHPIPSQASLAQLGSRWLIALFWPVRSSKTIISTIIRLAEPPSKFHWLLIPMEWSRCSPPSPPSKPCTDMTLPGPVTSTPLPSTWAGSPLPSLTYPICSSRPNSGPFFP